MSENILSSSIYQDGGATPPQPYDAELQEFHGQQVLDHNTPESVATALGQEQVDGRVFTFSAPSLFAMSQSIAFVDGQRRVHGFSTSISTDEKLQAVKDTVWGAIEANGHTEVDGVIRVDDQNGHVYRVYETDSPEEPERVEAQVSSWAEDVRAASAVNPEDGVIQHITENDVTIADHTQGRNHLVTVLRHEAGFTLDSVMEGLPSIPTQDNLPVLRWAQVIKP